MLETNMSDSYNVDNSIARSILQYIKYKSAYLHWSYEILCCLTMLSKVNDAFFYWLNLFSED